MLKCSLEKWWPPGWTSQPKVLFLEGWVASNQSTELGKRREGGTTASCGHVPTNLQLWPTCATVHSGSAKAIGSSFHHDEWDHCFSMACLSAQIQGQGKVPAVLCKFPFWVSSRLQSNYLKIWVCPSVATHSYISWGQCLLTNWPRYNTQRLSPLQNKKPHSTLELEVPPYFMDEGTEARGQEYNSGREEYPELSLLHLHSAVLLTSAFTDAISEKPSRMEHSISILRRWGWAFWLPSTLCSYSPPLLLKSPSNHQVHLFNDGMHICYH